MFLEFYGLNEQPFGVTPDPRFIYPSRTYSKAFNSLSCGIEAGRSIRVQVPLQRAELVLVLSRSIGEPLKNIRLCQVDFLAAPSLELMVCEPSLEHRLPVRSHGPHVVDVDEVRTCLGYEVEQLG